MSTNWTDITNIPTYVNAISGCESCAEIADIQGQILDILTQQNTKVSFNVFNKHHHDCRYFTKNQLKYPNNGGEVNWFNITSLSPAITAVYNSLLTPDILDALVTPISPSASAASSYNPFITLDYLNNSISAAEQYILSVQEVDVFNSQALSGNVRDDFSTRLSSSVYDEYYALHGQYPTRDWSPIAHHLEYFCHRRNPYETPINAEFADVEWVDEDIDGNKVWIGERQIFTGGKDGFTFQSGSFTGNNGGNPRASAPEGPNSSIIGFPDPTDLYNNVAPEGDNVREAEFANRQIIVYGGVEIGRNLTLLTPANGAQDQVVSAPGANATFKNIVSNGNLTYGGSLIQSAGKFHVDSTDGSIVSTGSLTIENDLIITNGVNPIFTVNSANMVGTQTHLGFHNFDYTSSVLTIAGKINTNTLVVQGSITNPNTEGYSAFFDSVLISGGLTIGEFFEIKNDLIIYGDSLFENSVTCCTLQNSDFVVGQTNSSIRAGDTYFINWNNSLTNDPSLFKVYAREVGAASNLFTLRISENYNGVDIGPINTSLFTASTNYIYDYAHWNGVDIRTTQQPNDVYKNNATWSGLEIKTYLSQVNADYKDSQYLLWTSNSHAFSKQVFPGNDAGSAEFPNVSDNFGWIMSDWFRTATEATSGIHLPLHLIASKDYVDYRMAQLNVAGSSFKVNPNNLSAGLNPSIHDVITWDGTQWIAAPVDIGSQLWSIVEVPTAGNLTLPAITSNTLFLITDEGLTAPFIIHLPQQQPADVGRIIQLKFVDLPEVAFPIRINGYGTDSIDTNDSYYVVVQQTSLQLMLAQAGKWYVI